jgi:hypothetical protein
MNTMEINSVDNRHEMIPFAEKQLTTAIDAELSDEPSETLSVEKLEQWLDEIRNQPRWRLTADKECDYYDGNQIDAETMEIMEERGQAPIIDNLIQPTINAVLGMQAKARVDTRVAPEAGETNTDVAEALSLKMKQVGDSARSDRAKSDAYAEMIKAGVSWVEVARNSDPFKPFVRYKHIHRREIYWDWRAKEPDLSDARYLVRRKWMDEDMLLTVFPEHRAFIKSALSGRANWDLELTGINLMTRGIDTDVSTGFTTSIEQYEWMNTTRKRLCVYEVWYRVHVRGQVIKLPNGRVIEYNEDDPQHQKAFFAGLIKPMQAAFDRIRVAFWIGPKLVSDQPSPYRHRHFPYVPFFAAREDRTGIPYGLIRSMISPQDEVNARKSKMMWLLAARRVKATEEAVRDHNEAMEEVARPDAYIVVSSKPGEFFEVEENGPMAAQQFKVMQEAKESIQTNVGVHNATLGRESGATSGLAINSLVEQDSITLAEVNDNFNMSSRLADELLLSLIIEDLSDTDDERVIVEDDGGKKREIVLNQKTVDPETGRRVILNDVTKVNVSVVLADTPNTPTFRNQQLNQLSEMVKTLPGNIQAMLMPFLVEATDLPKRKEMSALIRKGLGLGDDGEDPEKAQMQAEIEQLKQQLAMKHPPEVIAAQVEKLMAEAKATLDKSVESKITALYSALQAAQAVAANGQIVPIADQLAKSAGFVDQDGGDLASVPPGAQPGAPIDTTAQTAPLSPDVPASPAVGAAGGIETQHEDL